MDEDYFEQYIRTLDKLYEYDPVEAVDQASYFLDKLQPRKKRHIKLNNDQIDIVIMCILGLLIALCGLLPFDGFYYFGLIFFLAGALVGLYTPGFGIIFLFSHGLTGLWLMSHTTIAGISGNPMLSDSSPALKYYLSLMIIITVLAFALTILQSVFKKIREINHIKPFIMFLFFLGILLLRLLPFKLGIYKLFDFIH